MNSSNSLSLSPYHRCPSLLTIFVALHRTHSCTSMSSLHWGVQHWAQSSRCGFTRAEQTGRTTFLDLLAMLFLTAGQLVVHQDPQCFCKAAFQVVSPLLVLLHEVIPPQVQKSAFPFVELHETPISPFFQPVKVPLNSSTTIWYMKSHIQHVYTQQSHKGPL